MEKPKVLLISTGGTITMTPGASGGIVPTLTGDDLVKAVPALAEHCNLEVVSYSTRPGASLKIDDLIKMAGIITEAFKGDVVGAIIVQGTDTIEETAFVFDCLVDSPKPVIVTGAVRDAAMVGADGPASLLCSVIVASSPAAQGRGAMVVLNDEIHAARSVQKMDTSSVAAFGSPGFGPLGRITEQKAVFPRIHRKNATGSGPAIRRGDSGRTGQGRPRRGWTPAEIITRARLFRRGHRGDGRRTSAVTLPRPCKRIARFDAGCPRDPGARRADLQRTYSFPGSEMDLISRGLLPSGTLGSLRARLLLTLLLAVGFTAKQLETEFLSRL